MMGGGGMDVARGMDAGRTRGPTGMGGRGESLEHEGHERGYERGGASGRARWLRGREGRQVVAQRGQRGRG